jgi:hypothetical protein
MYVEVPMAWTVSVPVVAPEDFDATVSLALDREKTTLAQLGATHAADLAAGAAKELIKSWDVAGDPDRTFGAVLAGHANPGGEAPEGFGNDEISVHVWRSGNRAPSFDRAVKEAVAAELAKAEAKQAKADKKAEQVKADAKAEKKSEREAATAESESVLTSSRDPIA